LLPRSCLLLRALRLRWLPSLLGPLLLQLNALRLLLRLGLLSTLKLLLLLLRLFGLVRLLSSLRLSLLGLTILLLCWASLLLLLPLLLPAFVLPIGLTLL
jgi:hypothetical protein